MEEKPHWLIDHEEEDNRRFSDLQNTLNEIRNILKPIATTYETAGTMWKWIMALAVLVSIIVGIVVGLTKLMGK